MLKWWWPLRTRLWARATFGKQSYREAGRHFGEYHQIPKERNMSPLCITFAEVATHNHFVLERGGKVLKQTAPMIKLPEDATESEYLTLVGSLNSSVACFWMKRVFYLKGGDKVGQDGARVRKSLWEERLQISGTGLQKFPIPNEEGVPPKLIIFNGFLVGAGAQHCQGQIHQRDRFATTMTIPTRNGDFGATRAGSEWPARRAHSTACPNA